MDPTACLLRLLEAITERDTDEVRNAADDLATWLDRGGFVPPEAEACVAFVDAQRMGLHVPVEIEVVRASGYRFMVEIRRTTTPCPRAS